MTQYPKVLYNCSGEWRRVLDPLEHAELGSDWRESPAEFTDAEYETVDALSAQPAPKQRSCRLCGASDHDRRNCPTRR